ncbi:serine hydrolase domain-containing protein [Jannaschia faecimaris]|uniref:serine hydrolase domain-containing protein n=1 Tax=Jannaschia faecimaris TaxID=1244108 RepID=UPI001FCCE8BB|nr:serine hydrolase domain-containing protein [Jannaschia faecimaris]
MAGDLTNRLQATLEQILDRYDLPGATAAIVVPDGTVFGSAAGLADVELKRPMTPDTRLLAASIGKTFVGAMVLALESKGQVSQSDLLSKYLGDRPWFSGLPNAEAITLGHLLRHSSGLPDHPHLPEFHAAARARIARDGGRFTPEELIGFVVGKAPLFASGKGWAYTDTGYILLGLVVEAASGRSYYEMLTERFLDPLGLGDTVPSDTPDIPDLAVGYTVADNPFGLPQRTADRAGRLLWDPAMEWTGGGLASSASDLARWGHAFFGGEAMEAPYLDRLLDGVPIAPDTAGILYGTGVAIYTDTPDGPVYGHGGWIPGYVSSLRHYADHGVTVAFQINSDVGVVDDSSDHVAELEAMLARLAIEASQ